MEGRRAAIKFIGKIRLTDDSVVKWHVAQTIGSGVINSEPSAAKRSATSSVLNKHLQCGVLVFDASVEARRCRRFPMLRGLAMQRFSSAPAYFCMRMYWLRGTNIDLGPLLRRCRIDHP
jgi:hypothetical protein